eukprot:6489452-Amphidinium_carterae.1
MDELHQNMMLALSNCRSWHLTVSWVFVLDIPRLFKLVEPKLNGWCNFKPKLSQAVCSLEAKTFRVWHLVKVWQIHSGVSWFAIDLVTFVTISLLASHWSADGHHTANNEL